MSNRKYLIYTDAYIFDVIAEDQKLAVSLIEKKYKISKLKVNRIEIAGYGYNIDNKVIKSVLLDRIGVYDEESIITSFDKGIIYLKKESDKDKNYIGTIKDKMFYSRPIKTTNLVKIFIQENSNVVLKELKETDEIYIESSDVSVICNFVSGFWNFRINKDIEENGNNQD